MLAPHSTLPDITVCIAIGLAGGRCRGLNKAGEVVAILGERGYMLHYMGEIGFVHDTVGRQRRWRRLVTLKCLLSRPPPLLLRDFWQFVPSCLT